MATHPLSVFVMDFFPDGCDVYGLVYASSDTDSEKDYGEVSDEAYVSLEEEEKKGLQKESEYWTESSIGPYLSSPREEDEKVNDDYKNRIDKTKSRRRLFTPENSSKQEMKCSPEPEKLSMSESAVLKSSTKSTVEEELRETEKKNLVSLDNNPRQSCSLKRKQSPSNCDHIVKKQSKDIPENSQASTSQKLDKDGDAFENISDGVVKDQPSPINILRYDKDMTCYEDSDVMSIENISDNEDKNVSSKEDSELIQSFPLPSEEANKVSRKQNSDDDINMYLTRKNKQQESCPLKRKHSSEGEHTLKKQPKYTLRNSEADSFEKFDKDRHLLENTLEDMVHDQPSPTKMVRYKKDKSCNKDSTAISVDNISANEAKKFSSKEDSEVLQSIQLPSEEATSMSREQISDNSNKDSSRKNVEIDRLSCNEVSEDSSGSFADDETDHDEENYRKISSIDNPSENHTGNTTSSDKASESSTEKNSKNIAKISLETNHSKDLRKRLHKTREKKRKYFHKRPSKKTIPEEKSYGNPGPSTEYDGTIRNSNDSLNLSENKVIRKHKYTGKRKWKSKKKKEENSSIEILLTKCEKKACRRKKLYKVFKKHAELNNSTQSETEEEIHETTNQVINLSGIPSDEYYIDTFEDSNNVAAEECIGNEEEIICDENDQSLNREVSENTRQSETEEKKNESTNQVINLSSVPSDEYYIDNFEDSNNVAAVECIGNEEEITREENDQSLRTEASENQSSSSQTSENRSRNDLSDSTSRSFGDFREGFRRPIVHISYRNQTADELSSTQQRGERRSGSPQFENRISDDQQFEVLAFRAQQIAIRMLRAQQLALGMSNSQEFGPRMPHTQEFGVRMLRIQQFAAHMLQAQQFMIRMLRAQSFSARMLRAQSFSARMSQDQPFSNRMTQAQPFAARMSRAHPFADRISFYQQFAALMSLYEQFAAHMSRAQPFSDRMSREQTFSAGMSRGNQFSARMSRYQQFSVLISLYQQFVARIARSLQLAYRAPGNQQTQGQMSGGQGSADQAARVRQFVDLGSDGETSERSDDEEPSEILDDQG